MKEDLLIPSLVALAVALIAGVVSLVVSILSKDQKTSEFRQAWIDGLRDDASQLIAHLTILKVLLAEMRKKTTSEFEAFVFANQQHLTEVEMLATRMRLRLNPAEHQQLITCLSQTFDAGLEQVQMERAIALVVQDTQKILKSEWERVKRGESSFVWLKGISRFLSILAVMAALFGSGALAGKVISGGFTKNEIDACQGAAPAPASS